MLPKMEVSEIRAVQLDILNKVGEFCQANAIRYFLIGGTLIGAIRHKGYIPWDDDIDIGMLRSDYERFVDMFAVQGLTLLEPRTVRGFHCPFSKVSKDDTVIHEANDLLQSNYMGINIDVFPIDVVADDLTQQRYLLGNIRIWRKMLDAKTIVINKNRKMYKNITLYIAKSLLRLLSTEYIVAKITTLARLHEFEQSNCAGIIVWGYGAKEIVAKNCFAETKEIVFEGKVYPMPGGYHEYLTSVYGDYMQLPDADKQKSHHAFEAYWRCE